MSMVNYYLRKNPLTTSTEYPFMARVENKETLDHDRILSLMMRKNTSLTRQDITGVLDLFKETVKEQILDGYSVSTDLFKAHVGIKGGFESMKDEYDKSRHQVRLNMNAASSFRTELVNSVTVEKVRRKVRVTVIDQIYDYQTRAYGLSFTAGALVEMYGDCLLPEEGDPKLYIRQDGTEDFLALEQVHSATDKTILCNFPADAAPGNYWVYVDAGGDDDDNRKKYQEMVSIV